MKIIRNTLLITSIIPILFTFYVAAFNLNRTPKIKILIWQIDQPNIGLLIALGSTLGFSISSLNVLLGNNHSIQNRRRVINKIKDKVISNEEVDDFAEFNKSEFKNDNQEYYVERGIREPFPTISVPYKIIRQPMESNLNDQSKYEQEYDVVQPQSYSSNDNRVPFSEEADSAIENDWSSFHNEDW